MGIDDVLTVLREHLPDLRERYGVLWIALFGSVARGQANGDSDVDIIVEFGRPAGLFALVRLERKLEEFLGCKVDVVTLGALRPAIREAVLREAVRAA